MAPALTYPVRVDGRLDPQLSRWMWLVKWFLAIPHYFLLIFLWTAFVVLTVIALFAILFTGRYPKGIFDFNVGVLRWSWRVSYYALDVAATDRYPPFSLAEEPDYPATLHIDYPGELSRGLALVKWWLLAIPHYLVIAFFIGGGTYVASQTDEWQFRLGGAGLIGILVLISVVALLFTSRYPRGLFDLILGLNRWVIRVGAYAALMTDAYPPFRLDMGGTDPGTLSLSTPDPGTGGPAEAANPAPVQGAQSAEPNPPSSTTGPAQRWTGGRVAAVVIGALLILLGLPSVAIGTAAIVVDQTQRDADGFLMTGSERISTSTYALTSDVFDVDFTGPDWVADPGAAWVGDLAVRVQPRDDTPIFVGLARQEDLAAYLDDVEHDVVVDVGFGPWRVEYDRQAGSAPESPPTAQQVWDDSVTGEGAQTLRWRLEDGRWNLVVMNADASASVDVDMSVGAEFPMLGWIGLAMLLTGVILLIGGGVLLFVGLRPRSSAGQV